MKRNITMRDIAKKLNVSHVTVSKALNDKEGVSDELKLKIKKTAKALGYRLNTAAKSMKEGYSSNVGVLVAERFTVNTHSFYLNFYQQIAKALEEYKYYGILQTLSPDDEHQLRLPRICLENKVDGLILLGQINKDYIRLLQKTKMPLVLLDFYDEDTKIDSIVTDNFYGAYEVTNHLIKNGHREIAFVGNVYATSSIQDRFLGYYKSLLEHGAILRPQYVINDRNTQGDFVGLVLPHPLPTAFVCNCDRVARTLINKLKDLGFAVPADCSVVGFDHDIFATISSPRLTTVEVDMATMAKKAVEYILEKIKGRAGSHGRTLVKGRIIMGESVAEIRPACAPPVEGMRTMLSISSLF